MTSPLETQNSAKPAGTVTFLFTDIEGSTQRWEHEPAAMEAAWHRQEALVRAAIRTHGGYPYKLVGDAFQAAFQTAPAALAAAIAAQRALAAASWETATPLQVRMALHTGTTEEWPDDYVGPLLNRLARLLSAGHGGQILLTLATAELVRDSLPAGVELRDLGERQLKDLVRPEHVWEVVAPGLPADFPPLKTLDARPNNLPRQPTALIGREQEVAQVSALLRRSDVALVTLTGPGGTGKTRLALQAAAELLEAFPDGCWFVDLAPLADPALVPTAIAQTLSVKESSAKPLVASLKDYLAGKQALLLLDNFEQVLDAAPLVAALLEAAPRLKVLATSRARLRLRGEHELPVPPLALPDLRRLPPSERLSQYDAVRLFIERAVSLKPDFAVTNENAPAVAEICVRLDGLPLAIELAAARSKLLSPQAILARLSNRLTLLTGGARDLPARQQTLRDTIAWSYDLLNPGEQQLFRRLAVFQGGLSLAAIEAIANAGGSLDVLDGLQELLDKSLLRQGEGPGGEPRFWLLDTIHEFAAEKLAESGEEAPERDRHLDWFLALAEQAEPCLTGVDQLAWLDRLDAEHDNSRAALAWAVRTPAAARPPADAAVRGLRLAVALMPFWQLRGPRSEGRAYMAAALGAGRATAAGDMAPGVWARALAEAAQLAYSLGDYEESRTLAEESLAGGQAAESRHNVAAACDVLGLLAHSKGAHEEAKAHFVEGLAVRQALGDRPGIAESLDHLSNVAYRQRDYPAARALLEESLALWQALGDRSGTANAVAGLGFMAARQGDHARAEALLTQSLALHRALGDRVGIASMLGNLGQLVYLQGHYAEARALREEALALFRDLGERPGIAWSVGNLGRVALVQGDYAGARAYLEEELALRRELGDRGSLPGALNGLGNLAAAQGDWAGARALYQESLTLSRDLGDASRDTVASLAGLGAVLAGTAGAADGLAHLRAAHVLGAATALREGIGTTLYPDDRLIAERAATDLQGRLGEAAFAAAWTDGQRLSLEEARTEALAFPTEEAAPDPPSTDAVRTV